jgi:hypothetical protein
VTDSESSENSKTLRLVFDTAALRHFSNTQ